MIGPTSRTGTFSSLSGVPPSRWPLIYSKHHALLSVLVGVGFLAVGPATSLPAVVLVGYAVAVGVGIDFDHFLVAWLRTGRPRAIRNALANPRAVFFDQGSLFEPDELTKLDRLLSHVVIAGVVVSATWYLDPAVGLLTAVVLYVHLLSDLVWDVFVTPPVRGE